MQIPRRRWLDSLLAWYFVGVWGSGYIATKIGLQYAAPFTFLMLRYAFEELGLHRVEAVIVPRNERSRRVVEKLDIRNEGVAVRYLEINGTWEDHVRYAITVEEWELRRDELIAEWISA